MKIIVRKLLCTIFIVSLFIRPMIATYSQKDAFFSKGYHEQYTTFKAAYGTSQYMQKKNPGIIPDDTLEAFAGGFFLNGGNPILIIHDQPPLGRYITALSIFLFDNANTLTLPLLVISLVGVFLISKLVIKNTLVSLLPVGMFANEPLFLSKLNYVPLLEPIQLPFIIFALYFFVRGIIEKKSIWWFILTSFMLGFVISIRFFVLGGVLLASMLGYISIKRQLYKKTLLLLTTIPLSLLVLVLSYAKTLQAGYNVLQIFGIQKYILAYHKSQVSYPFSFWDLLLFNRWHTWWGSHAILQDPEWIILWPIASFLTLFYLMAVLTKKLQFFEVEKIILFWIFGYSIMLSIGETSTRYFLPILPFLYILGVSFVYKIVRLSKLIHIQ